MLTVMARNRKTLDDLTPAELREQVLLCHEHMQRCCEVLDGADMEPVELVDVNDSADLELFYKCKRLGGLSRRSRNLLRNGNRE